eukprot:108018_1
MIMMDVILKATLNEPLDTYIVNAIFFVDLLVFGHYYVYYELFDNNNKKYLLKSKNKPWWLRSCFIIHVFSGIYEIIIGYIIILSNKWLISFLPFTMLVNAMLFHIPTSFLLSPFVWGIKYLTIFGYIFASILRSIKAYNLYKSLQIMNTIDISDLIISVQELWILIHMAIVVRFCSAYVFPFTTKNGTYGDLSTHPIYYTMSVVTVALVFPSWVNILFLMGFSSIKLVFRLENMNGNLKSKNLRKCETILFTKTFVRFAHNFTQYNTHNTIHT